MTNPGIRAAHSGVVRNHELLQKKHYTPYICGKPFFMLMKLPGVPRNKK